jgi:hypothetical protein
LSWAAMKLVAIAADNEGIASVNLKRDEDEAHFMLCRRVPASCRRAGARSKS